MKTIVVEFRNAYNIGILPQLLLFDIAYNILRKDFDIKSCILE